MNVFLSEDFDVDDVGALCAAHGLVELGEAEILTVGTFIDKKKHRIYCKSTAISSQCWLSSGHRSSVCYKPFLWQR